MSLALLSEFVLATNAMAAQPGGNTWADYNRVLTAGFAVLQHNYTEADAFGLTTNGTLDSEDGTLRSAELGARWQAPSFPLLLQAGARRSNGGTRYSGYLQTGNQLTPFRATTGNIMRNFSVRAGLPVAQGQNWQWVPYIEFQQQRWQRGLAQYTENFRHTAGLAGLQLQWRQHVAAEAAAGVWSFELDGAVGRVLAANMEAASLGFDQPLGKRGLWQLGATLAYELTPQWRINVGATARVYNYGQSALQGGVLEPSSRTRQTAVGIGLGWRY